MIITSRNNPIIKSTRALSSAKERRERGLHLIEGEKLVREAISSGAIIESLFVEEGYAFLTPPGVNVYEVSRGVLESIAESRTPQGVAAVVYTPASNPPPTFADGLYVLLDGVQDPGNVGAIIRSADAFGAVAVCMTGDCADAYSGKALRAAMGSTYHLPLYRSDAAAQLDAFTRQGFTCVCGHLHGDETLPATGNRAVLVIGSEGSGVSEEAAARCVRYRLPMLGKAESLNASVAAGVLLYIFSNMMREA